MASTFSGWCQAKAGAFSIPSPNTSGGLKGAMQRSTNGAAIKGNDLSNVIAILAVLHSAQDHSPVCYVMSSSQFPLHCV